MLRGLNKNKPCFLFLSKKKKKKWKRSRKAHVKLLNGWATITEDYVGFHFYQSKNRKLSLRWERNHQPRTAEDWKMVGWSDEPDFCWDTQKEGSEFCTNNQNPETCRNLKMVWCFREWFLDTFWAGNSNPSWFKCCDLFECCYSECTSLHDNNIFLILPAW